MMERQGMNRPKVVVGSPGSGKSTRLIDMCREANRAGRVCYIVAATSDRAAELSRLAEETGDSIPAPITPRELRTIAGSYITELLVDDVFDVLKVLAHGRNIAAVTADAEMEHVDVDRAEAERANSDRAVTMPRAGNAKTEH